MQVRAGRDPDVLFGDLEQRRSAAWPLFCEVESEPGEVALRSQVALEVVQLNREWRVSGNAPSYLLRKFDSVVAHGPGGNWLVADLDDCVVQEVSVGWSKFEGIEVAILECGS